MKGYIYMISCLVNNKAYIGQTSVSIDKRVRGHILSLGKNNSTHLQKAFVKYGVHNFIVEELDCVECDSFGDLHKDILEKFYISYYKTFENGYNMTEGGEGVKGYKYPEEKRIERALITKKFLDNHPEHLKLLKRNVLEYFSNPVNRARKSLQTKKQWEKQRFILEKGLKAAQTKAKEARKKPVLQFDLSGNLIREFSSIKDAKIFIGGCPNIEACCKGKPKHATAGGFIWKYKII